MQLGSLVEALAPSYLCGIKLITEIQSLDKDITMTTRLIYHTSTSANGGLSPFDEAICSIVRNRDINIACPYLGLNYLKRIFSLSNSWKILTDVEEWLASL